MQGDYIVAFGNSSTIGLGFDAVIDVSIDLINYGNKQKFFHLKLTLA